MSVYMSSALQEQFPRVFHAIADREEHEVIPSTNLWIRDWMPVKIDNYFAKFLYKDNTGKYPWMLVPNDCCPHFNAKRYRYYLDGGNVVQNDSTVFITEQVFENNWRILATDLKQFLKDIFRKKIIYIPVEPGDDLGHADGIIKFKDDKTVIINDYSMPTRPVPKLPTVEIKLRDAWMRYSDKLEHILDNNGFDVIKIPWAYGKCPKLTEREFRARYPLADEKNEGLRVLHQLPPDQRQNIFPDF